MASAWGKAWGNSWGNSWGRIAGQQVSGETPTGGWFGYPLDGGRRRREEDERAEAIADAAELALANVAEQPKPIRKITRAEIDAARAWADGLSKGEIPFSLPSLQSFEAAFAFPADQRLSEDEAIALVLLLSES